MSEGFYSRKTGQWWDQVIERREAGDDDTAFDIARDLIIELDEKAGRLEAERSRWAGVVEKVRAVQDVFRTMSSVPERWTALHIHLERWGVSYGLGHTPLFDLTEPEAHALADLLNLPLAGGGS